MGHEGVAIGVTAGFPVLVAIGPSGMLSSIVDGSDVARLRLEGNSDAAMFLE
jgi:hypothetical protein